jgi:hypothetical protein
VSTPFTGEIRGQIGLPRSSTSVNLYPLQQPYAVVSSASAVASVVITGPLTVNVSMQLLGLANQTMARIHVGGESGRGDVHVPALLLRMSVLHIPHPVLDKSVNIFSATCVFLCATPPPQHLAPLALLRARSPLETSPTFRAT